MTLCVRARARAYMCMIKILRKSRKPLPNICLLVSPGRTSSARGRRQVPSPIQEQVAVPVFHGLLLHL